MTGRSYTGRGRRGPTRRSVVLAEWGARSMITFGGIGTIVALGLIFVFLAAVVLPLFGGAEAANAQQRSMPAAEPADRALVRVGVDEERLMAWVLREGGALDVVQLGTGELARRASFGDEPVSAFSFGPGGDVVLALPGGRLALASVGFRKEFLTEEPAALEGLEVGASTFHGGGVVVRTPEHQLRRTSFTSAVAEPFPTGHESSVVLLAHSSTPSRRLFAAWHEDGALRVYLMRERPNLLTGEIRRTMGRQVELSLDGAPSGRPAHLLLASTDAYAAWEDGTLLHYDLRDLSNVVRDEVDVVPEDGRLTAMAFVLGETTFLTGDSNGRLRAWFPALQEEGGQDLVLAHDLGRMSAEVTALAPSERSRLMIAGSVDGAVRVLQVTNEQTLVEVSAGDASVDALALAPKENGVLAAADGELWTWSLDTGHHEATIASLFGRVWYEGSESAEHVWQSSSGTDDFEPKLGLLPLVFGTLKATVYSMIFGAPLALLAAIFSSEFLSRRLRAPVKSTIELMASLPSVVLGFFAALYIAPIVRDVLPGVLLVFLSVPVAVLGGAYLWQLLPHTLSVRWSGGPRFLGIVASLALGMLAALTLGGPFERLVFAGDVEAWLDGQVGSAVGGWFFLLIPLSGLAVAVACTAWVTPRIAARDLDRGGVGRLDLAKFALGFLATLGLAAVVGFLLDAAGLDPRGGVFGTYVQRNALIVGFVMGFAIIPIIYTLAEDALSEVPSHLREASLGAGATRWQTAVRIVVPTAMSGLFSALMIGLGRAVGETMIVLMAAGNTPIMDWNLFNGFRTLSANIAVELPEAVRNSTHYRTLFLAAIVLFAMTFVLNTLAEAVRRHFRRKTQAL